MRRAIFFSILLPLSVLLLLLALYLGRSVWTEWLLHWGEQLASRSLGGEVRAEALSWGFGEEIALKGLRMRTGAPGPDSGETVLSVEEIRVLPEWAELLRGRLVLDSVQVVVPRLRIGKDSQGKWLFPGLSFSRGSEKAARGKPLSLNVRRLALEGGSVSLQGTSEPLVRNVQFRLRDFSIGAPGRGSFDLSAQVFPQGEIELEGWIAAGAGPIQTEARFTGTGFSLKPLRELLAPYGLSVDRTLLCWDLQWEGGTEEGLGIKGRVVLGPVESSLVRGPMEEVTVRCDLLYGLKESSLRARNLEIEAGDVLRAAFQGLLPTPSGRDVWEGTVRVDRIDLSRLQLPGGLLLAGLLSADPFPVRWEKSRELPIAEGVVQVQDWGTVFGGFHVKGPKLEIAFSRENRIRLNTPLPATLTGKTGGPLVRPLPVRFSVGAVLENRGAKFEVELRIGASQGRLGREGVVSWKEGEWFLSGRLGQERFEARVKGTIQHLRYGDVTLPEVATALDLERTEGLIILREPRIQAKGFSFLAGWVSLGTAPQGLGKIAKWEGLATAYPAAGVEIKGGKGEILWVSDSRGAGVDWDVSFGGGRAGGVLFARAASSGRLRPSGFRGSLSVHGPKSGMVTAQFKGKGLDSPFPTDLEISIQDWDLESLSAALEGRFLHGVGVSGRIQNLRFEGVVHSPLEITGQLAVEAVSLSAAQREANRFLFKEVSLKGGASFRGPDLFWSVSLTCGALGAQLEGRAESFARPERRLSGHVTVPPVELAALREGFWDLVPDRMLYLGLEGTAAADVDWASDRGVFRGQGMVLLDRVRLEGEYGEFAFGPVNGKIPVSYSSEVDENWAEPFPDFRKSAYETLLQGLESGESALAGSERITVGEIAVGFPLVQNLELSVRSEKGCVRIDRIAGEAFGGKIRGMAAVRAGPRPGFKVGLVAQGIRLSSLCEVVEPIQGYLSGCVDGTVGVEGSGAGGLGGLSGRAEFWTYSKGSEKTRISRQLLEKIAGRSMPMLFRDRPFDKGELTVFLNRGFMVFQDLEISNKNFVGVTDLSVRVAPQNNRIAVDHFVTSLAAAAARARNAQHGP